jgi:hypothetical protein
MSRVRAGSPKLVAVLALAGAVALASSFAVDGDARIERAGPNVPVNPGANDQANIDSNNSPTLARNPRRPAHLAVVNRVDTPAYKCGLYISRDSGAHWSSTTVPIPRGEEPKCFAPDVTFAADGTLHMSYVTLRGNGNRPHAVWVVSSADGGRTLSAPRRVRGPLAFQVRLTADPARPERLYLTWVQPSSVGLLLFSGNGNRVEATRSDDGGRTWNAPVTASDPQRRRVIAPAPAVGPDGALYVLYLDIGDDRLDFEGAHRGAGGPPYSGRFSLVLARSTDAGKTWQESLVDDRVVPTRRFVVFLPPFPSLAVDPRDGRIYAAFEDGGRRPSDVHLWTLAPGARDWDGPTRVNDTPAGDRSWQYLPKVAVAPGGRVDVAYYDRRDDRSGHRNAVSVQSSFDAGRTFTARTVLSDQSFDARIGVGSERGLADIGSRIGLASGAADVLVAWTDTRAGTEASNKQDIGFARADVTAPRPFASAAGAVLRYGGIALLLAAAGLVAARARRPGGGPSA